MLLVLIWIASTSWGNSNEYQQHMFLDRSRLKHKGCNLKTKKLLDCALIGVVIRSNMVYYLNQDMGTVEFVLHQNISSGFSLEFPHCGNSSEYPQELETCFSLNNILFKISACLISKFKMIIKQLTVPWKGYRSKSKDI